VSSQEPVYNLTATRELLLHAFTATTLRHFCQDRPLFRPVLNYVSHRPSKVELVDTLIEHCQTQLLWEELLEEVQAFNPRQYERYADRLILVDAEATPPGQAGLAPGVWLCPEEEEEEEEGEDGAAWVGSTQSRIYHHRNCYYVDRIQSTNRLCFANPGAARRYGRVACSVCRP
jgi:hypothetical protein